ncbi:hypothetical protein N9D47_02520 [Planktomarina temperata]|nr:hypothetical protein [Planktomarina temperata]
MRYPSKRLIPDVDVKPSVLFNGIFIPYIILYSILGSSIFPSITEGGFVLYHLISVVFSVIFIKIIYIFLIRNKYLFFFILYILLHFFIEISYVDPNLITGVLIRLLNFLTSLSMMVLFIVYLRKHREKLDGFVGHFVVVVTLFGFYQLIARILNLPFGLLEHNSFRDLGSISQATSFFREPRFYGMFIATFLYFTVFYYKSGYKSILILLLVLSGLSTLSVTAYLMLSVVLMLSIFRNLRIRSIVKAVSLSSIFFFALLQFEPVSNGIKLVSDRLSLISNIEYADALQFIQTQNRGQGIGDCPVNAGCATIFGELGSLYGVLSQSPIFGYGLKYSFGDIFRPMALNGIVEVVLRWGLLGLIMFFGFMLRKRIDRYRLFVFVLFFLIAFGNLGQALFWVLLSLIYIAHSKPILHNKNIRQLNG